MKKRHPLTAWRHENAITQSKAARLLRVNEQTWYRWEAGRHPPKARHLRALARMTGIAMEKLVGL